MRSRILRRSALLVACVLLAGGTVRAKEESKIQVDLENLGVVPGASAKLRSKLDAGDATLQVKARRLQGGAEYIVSSDGIEQARCVAASNGHVNVKLDLVAADAASPRIPFDPRGHWVALSDGAQEVLGAWYSTTGEPRRTKVKEWTDLAPEAIAAGGTAQARYDRRPNGKARFWLHVSHAPAGSYDVLVAGAPVATFETNGSGSASLQFRTNGHGKKTLSLDFDPRGELVEIMQGTDLYFSGEMLAQIDGLNVCTAGEAMVAMSAAPGETGAGTATLATEDDCDLELRVDMTGLSPGDHEVHVDGVLVGTVTVDGTGAGAATWDVGPDDAGEALLEMDPSGGMLEVVRVSDQVVVMTATLP